MANPLGREIEHGEIVVLNKAVFHEEFHSDLRFQCFDGYGTHSFTSGTKIFGKFMIDGEETTIDAYWIDVAATEALHLPEIMYRVPGRIYVEVTAYVRASSAHQAYLRSQHPNDIHELGPLGHVCDIFEPFGEQGKPDGTDWEIVPDDSKNRPQAD